MIPIESIPRAGYRLPYAVDMLETKEIRGSCRSTNLEELHVLLTVDSTNRWLLERPAPTPQKIHVCTTEVQSAGRGRRGRAWSAPFGSGVTVSFAYQFETMPSGFSALGLVVGIATVRALSRRGVADVKLKWPNDLVWDGRKLGGILIEMRGEAGGPAKVVIGIGLNMHMPSAARIQLANEHAVVVTDLNEIARGKRPSRNIVVAELISELDDALTSFSREGFAPFEREWRELDALAGAYIKVMTHAGTVSGAAQGISSEGALLVDVNGTIEAFMSGEVSVRALRDAERERP